MPESSSNICTQLSTFRLYRLLDICPKNYDDYRYGTIVVKEDNVRTVISVTQGGKCISCHGNQTIGCTACFGQGSTGFGYFSSTCFFCGGSGTLKCSACNDTGYKE